MRIVHNPPIAAVKEILAFMQLPTADITPGHMEHFFGLWVAEALVGVVGIEPYGRESLLRSLAVVPTQRGAGLGTKLLAHAEQYAHSRGTQTLFLLTTTAASYFARQGYAALDRAEAPAAIRCTEEFASLCPSAAVLMRKMLTGRR